MGATRGSALAAAAALTVLVVLGPASSASAAPSPVALGGEPVPGGGSTDSSTPTALEAGLWSMTLSPAGDGGDVRHVRYQRTMAGSTVRVAVVAAGDTVDGADLELSASADGEQCGSPLSEYSETPTTQAAFGGGFTFGPGEVEDACTDAAAIDLAVARGDLNDGATDLPVALKIVEEAPVPSAAVGDQPVPEESPTIDPPDGGGPSDGPDGAAGYDDAPSLEPATHAVTVGSGEQLFWRVRLGWGQGLEVSARAPVPEEDDPAASSAPGVSLRLYGPLRAPLDGYLAETDPDGYYGFDPLRLTAGVPPVTYRGREEGAAPSVPGDVWVSLAVEPAGEDEAAVEVPVELTVEVTGEVEEAPPYAETVTSFDAGPGPDGYAPDTPFLVAAGTFAADPSGNPVVAAPGSGSGEGSSSRTWWGAGLAVASLLCCAAGVLRLRAA